MVERVLPRDFPVPPEFMIPLDANELRELGTFTAIWSQIDWIVMLMISRLAKVELGPLQLMVETMTTGPRVGLLTKLCQQNPSPTTKQIAKLCKKNGGLIEHRNHVIHGLWCVRWEEGIDLSASCLYSKGGREAIPATKLQELSNRAAKFSNALGEHLKELIPTMKVGAKPRLFLFGKGAPHRRQQPPWPPKSPSQPQ